MSIVAIDPGSEQSAWIALSADGLPIAHGLEPNEAVLRLCRTGFLEHLPDKAPERLVIEWTAPRGMPASAQLFETLFWAGRFFEARPVSAVRVQRADVKRHLTGTTAARDSNVIAALIDRYGGTGGKEAAVGRKAAPGPLYGVRRDIWQALAVGVCWLDTRRQP